MKKLVAFFVATCVVLSLTACSSGQNNGTSTAKGVSTATTKAVSTSTTKAVSTATTKAVSTTKAADTTAKAAGTTSKAAGKTDWPKQPITIVVGYTAGGDLDINAREYAEKLKKILNVDVVVSNVAGASGTTAATQVKGAKADGYTILYHQPALMISQLQGLTDYGLEAYDLCCMAAELPGDILCVNKSLGVKNMKELYEYCEKNPGKVKLAASAGTMNYIQALQMKKLGFNLNIVDGGNATERVANLLGGHVDAILNSYATVKDYLTTGDFIAIATASTNRADAYKDIPTAKEQNYNVYFDKYHYFAFPKGTDPAIIEKFSQACKQVTEDSGYISDLWDKWGQKPCWMNATDTKKTMDETWKMLQDYASDLKG